MSINVLFAALPDRWETYETPLRAAFDAANIDVDLRVSFPPEEVDYIIYAPNSELQDFTPYTRAKAVLNLWAGVENITTNETLNIPLTRMVDNGLTRGMVEWVTGHVLRHHLGMDRYIVNPTHEWDSVYPPLATARRVTILGLGALGLECANALTMLGFPVSGWSRSEKSVPNITTYHGVDGLTRALECADILVLLLPATAQTENTLNAETLAQMPRGAMIINPGRGPLIDDGALIDALDSGHIAHATLDVFRVEPLAQNDPYWAHPNVTVTPHVASETRADTAAQVIAENIRRGELGDPLLYLVDRTAGY